MSEPLDEVKTSKPWQWPGEWMRDEKFWREVGSRFLAGLFVVILVFVVGRVSGYIGRPDVRQGLDPILLFIVPSSLMFFGGILVISGYTNLEMLWKHQNIDEELTSRLKATLGVRGFIQLALGVPMVVISIWLFLLNYPEILERILPPTL